MPNVIKTECVGCDETGNLTRCGGTMCEKCWVAENDDDRVDSIRSDYSDAELAQ